MNDLKLVACPFCGGEATQYYSAVFKGGHPEMSHSEYCNFRGDQSKCIALLERCLKAMKKR